MTDAVLHNMVEALRIAEDRFRVQVEALHRVEQALQGDLTPQERSDLAATVRLAAAEVEHGCTAWRRAVHRTLTDTQPLPIDVSLG